MAAIQIVLNSFVLIVLISSGVKKELNSLAQLGSFIKWTNPV